MAVIAAALVLLFAKASFAVNSEEVCANCEYNNGVGYIGSPDNCHVYYQCEIKPGGWIVARTMCCPNGTVWLPEHLTCYFGHCDDSYDPCPEKVTTTDYPCPNEPVEGNPKQYKVIQTWDIKECPVGTVYDEEECACVHGYADGDEEDKCFDDPLIYFPFANHYNDIQCHKVQGTPHGDAELQKDGGYVRLDGDGDYVSFGFLANYFAWRKLEHFTVSVWFNQTQEGWDNINNSPIEGIFGNGDCRDDASVWMSFGNETQQGGIRTDSGSALFEDSGADKADRFYEEPNVWCQIAIRYTETEVTLFLNGKVTGKRSITGYVANTFAASTIGLAILDCIPYFFTGCIDDLMIFTRFVSNDEMDYNVFGRARTLAGAETPYESDFFP